MSITVMTCDGWGGDLHSSLAFFSCAHFVPAFLTPGFLLKFCYKTVLRLNRREVYFFRFIEIYFVQGGTL